MTRVCGCPSRGVVAVDQAAHDRWHALATEQQGVTALYQAGSRQMTVVSLPSETVSDARARLSGKRASAALRRACDGD